MDYGAIFNSEEDFEGEANSEVTEWTGRSQIQATMLLDGGFAGAEATSSTGDEVEAELTVDEDDTKTFGPSQYTEADLVVLSSYESDEHTERQALMAAVISRRGTARTLGYRATFQLSVKEEPMVVDSSRPEEPKLHGDQTLVLEALKSRIRDLESETETAKKYLCLICMEHFKKPLVAVSCWHVQCEECWLRTLGAKKLCPQCDTITLASDLRRIQL